MGSMISRLFKRKREKSTYEKLEAIELKIKEIEEFSDLYQLKQRRFVGNVLLYGLGTSVIAFLVFYFAFLPKTLEKRVVYSIPIISLPAFIFLLKNLVAYYYQRKVNSNAEELAELRSEKRELLDHVKTKETYKDAVEILQRFGNANDRSFSTPSRQSSASPPENISKVMVNTSTNMTPSVGGNFKTPVAARQLVHRNILQQRMNAQQTPQMDPNRTLAMIPSSAAVIRGMKRTPYPIIDNSQKSVVDKMVDYLIGDGPTNRFAMICQQCFKHNGMALQEEYEYAAFRCAFCNFFNPAKKLRPIAPRLSSELALQPSQPSFNIQSPSSSDSSSCSDTDNEISKRKLQNVTETEPKQIVESEEQEQNDELEIESIGDEIEFIDKPERQDIEKKLE
ncbi:endoplasmic reticulum junction formation protein lunapark-A [Chironomus tepperi]|uniref:endoplasmic reticulum junction formation protein lunapark-A n=1 Tax=Chironomus tepperi TaxID=113505 RepID=UPI00391F6E39